MNSIEHAVNVSNDVLFGKSGYLYLWMGRQEQFAYLTGTKLVPLLSENNFKANIAGRREYLFSKGIPYMHVVFPSKPLVKSSFLPEGVNVSSLYLRFQQQDSVFYPLNDLLKLESEVSTFRKFDTHMTDSGTLCVVKALVDQLESGLSDKVIFSSHSKLVSGDLAKMLDSEERSYELYLKPVKSDGSGFNVKAFNNHSTLKGNSGRITVQHCMDSLTDKRLVIFGDSFFQASLHLLAPFFKDILFVRSPFFFKEVITLFKPDVVFTGNAERYLQSVPNDKDCNFFFFQGLYRSGYDPDLSFLTALSAQLSFGPDFLKYKKWSKNLEASLLNEQANVHIMAKEFDAAVILLEKVVKIKPNNVKLQQKLSDCLKYIQLR